MKKGLLWFFTALLILSSTFPATAKAERAATSQGEASAQQGDKKNSYLLAPVVVTADKMETDVQKTPSSISVLTSDTIETRQIEKTRDIFNAAPNMFFVKAGPDAHTGDSFAAVRGVTSFMSGAPVIGFYVDDMYIPGYDMPLFDIEKIEVLRGPQGTLYGRNSEGGVISVFTQKPGNELKAKISQSYGSYNTSTTNVVGSGPLIEDRLSFNVAAQFENSDGVFTNSANDSDSVDAYHTWTGRGSVYFTPNDELNLSLTFDGQTYDGHYAEFNKLSEVHDNPNNVTVDWAGNADKNACGNTFRAEWTPGDLKLLSITGYRHTYTRGDQDMDFTTADLTRYYITTDNDLFTQEFRLQSMKKNTPFKWITGMFLFHEEEDTTYKYAVGQDDATLAGEYFKHAGDTKTNGVAVFGQGTYALGPVDITMGLRYEYESKNFDYDNFATAAIKAAWLLENENGSSDTSYGAWLPKAAVNWHVTDNVMPYVSVSRGFRSGGFNLNAVPGQAYDPEYTLNYEAGAKTQWLGNTLTVNLAAFYIQWQDVQVIIPNYPDFEITNAGKAVSKGLELEAAWRPLAGLELFGNGAYTDARFTENSDGTNDYSGNRVPNVPLYTFSTGLTYRFWDNYMVSAENTCIGNVQFDQENTTEQSSYNLVNAKLGYESENADVYLWAKNLFGEKYATRAFTMNGEWYGRSGDPRAVGLTATVKF